MENLEFNWKLQDSGFESTDKLFRTKAFLKTSDPEIKQVEEIFICSMREAFEYHYANSIEFKGHADLAGVRSKDIQTLHDVENIPWIFVQNFKDAELLSIKKNKVHKIFTSSGTGGSKTQLFLDETSFNRLQVAAFEVYKGLGILNETEPCNYLLFTYDIEKVPNLGTAWTDTMISKMVLGSEVVYLIRQEGDGFRFDLELALEKYQKFIKSGKPIRILGFPAFIYHTFFEAQKRGIKGFHNLNQNSWVLTGGGWKNHNGEIIGKIAFAEFIKKSCGIPVQNVRDLFGMSEHGIGYVDCEYGRLHVPVYAHAVVRDPITLKILPEKKEGLLHLYSPLLKSYPSISLLTTDEAKIDRSPCRCGRSGAGIEIVGRVGLKNYEGCALRALEYLSV